MLDLSKIPFEASPNMYIGRGGNKVNYLILHSMAGSFAGSEAWFKNPKSQVSAHYLVSKTGQLLNMVRPENRAWHCYLLNGTSIGIEHEDNQHSNTDPHWVTPEMWEASTSLAAALVKKYDIPLDHILGHNDPFVTGLARKAGKPGMIHGDPGKFFDISKYRLAVQAKLDGK